MLFTRTSITKLLILSMAVFIFVPSFALAAPSWWPIVPCGTAANPTPCNPCDLFKMGRNIIDFVLMGLMPPVAAGLFIWGGFLILMGGPNPALFAKGKQIFTTTFYGVLIILGSWLITNTIMMSVAKDSIMVGDTVVNIVTDWNKFECVYTEPAPAPAGTLIILPESLPDAVTNITNYNEQLSVAPNATGISPYKWSQSGNLPAGLSFNASAATITGTPTQSGAFTFTIKVEDSSTAQKSTGTRTYSINIGGLVIRTISPLSDAIVGQEYTQIFMAEGGMSRTYEWSFEGTVPEELNGKLGTGGGLKFTPTTEKTLSFTVKVKDATIPTALTASKTFTLKIGSSAGICPDSEKNLCQGQSTNCSASSCSQYSAAINQYAGGAASANLLKAIMVNESSCNIGAKSGAGACGLMQLLPATANQYKTQCGVSETITCDWLTSSANAGKSICIASKYLQALSQTSCGSSPRNIAAGYNGGSTACENSVSCSGQTSCDNSPTKKWECAYDNPEHSVCNTGYAETRNYATKVLYCYNNPGF